MTHEPPIAYADLRDLFEHLDRASMNGYECSHRLYLTEQFLTSRQLPATQTLAWLSQSGAGCDCEVMFNVAQEWEERVGYVPPDDEPRSTT
jgi:hypothetical protein